MFCYLALFGLKLDQKQHIVRKQTPFSKNKEQLAFSNLFMYITGVIKLPIFGGMKQCKYMVNLKEFPCKRCIVWVGNIMIPV